MESEIELYKKILTIRAVENKLDYLFKRGLAHGTVHLCVGQEYIPVIISAYLKKEDAVTSTHRGHGHALAKGLDIKKFIAEVLGKRIGYNCGKGGSQHIISKEDNFYMNGVTGGMVPVANGIAFANKYLGNNKVVVAYLGDGGFDEGYVQEALNIASVFKLPVLFVCENNQYAMSTPAKKSHSNEIYKRADSLSIKSEVIESNDFLKLDRVAREFIGDVREKSEPRFIEVRTYRHYGHSKNDMNLYRDKAEEKFWFDIDVLKILEAELAVKLGQEKVSEIKREIEEKIDKISEEVISSEENCCESLLNNVYAK